MEELHTAIARFLRVQRGDTARGPRVETEREAPIPGLGAARRVVPRCVVCGRPVDDDGGLFNLQDMQARRQCEQHYCPF
jgi:hypothetical protein